VQLIDESGAAATVVVPHWPAQPWYQRLQELAEDALRLPSEAGLFSHGSKTSSAAAAWQALDGNSTPGALLTPTPKTLSSLTSVGLTGTIPASLGNLSALTVLCVFSATQDPAGAATDSVLTF
jgi:hypothetical protein